MQAKILKEGLEAMDRRTATSKLVFGAAQEETFTDRSIGTLVLNRYT
ncbi:hypothetical protein B14911_27380 [Bacillus sp. NRRL B-14911]|nr:hypothetical protein B14911_27380 [Bacillus sp. NRRL B-14911]